MRLRRVCRAAHALAALVLRLAARRLHADRRGATRPRRRHRQGRDGKPIKGATITAENANIGSSFTATTDDKGRFTIIGLRAGTWRFIAQAPGFAAEGGADAGAHGQPESAR